MKRLDKLILREMKNERLRMLQIKDYKDTEVSARYDIGLNPYPPKKESLKRFKRNCIIIDEI